MQLIHIELSKAYLQRALRCKDSDSDSIYCLANVYLAVLYYTTGQYQMAIDHCTLVTRSQDHSQCSSHVVQGELLPKIDDDIDIILGLTVFYQYVRMAALNQQQERHHVSMFTPKVFAYYLHYSLLLITQCHRITPLSLHNITQQCAKYISDVQQLFIVDVLVFISVGLKVFFKPREAANLSNPNYRPKTEWNTCKCGRPDVSETDLNTSELVELLQQCAVEHLTAYRQLIARDFDSVATIVTTDFEALYAYKHGDYQRCLQLSVLNICTMSYATHVGLCPLHIVTMLPEFIQFMDDDIVSLTALTLIVKPDCRYKAHSFLVSQLTLSLYLMTQCQLKLRWIVKSLAQTLVCIEAAQRKLAADCTLDHLTLKLIKCKLLIHLSDSAGI